MAQVNLRINGYAYLVGCADGQEQHLEAMGAALEKRIARARALGPQSEARMLLLGALLLADDLYDQESALTETRSALTAAERSAREAVATAEVARAEAARAEAGRAEASRIRAEAAALPAGENAPAAPTPEFTAWMNRLAERAEEIADALERS